LKEEYDIIVIGGGHAGCEATSAAALMGSRVLLITMDLTKIAQMSCNPAIGGVAKGQIVREIDALGGFTGIVADRSMLQFKMLNRSKGPAMWSPRAQCDRMAFSIEWRKILESNSNVFFWQDTVKELIIKNDVVKGVKTMLGCSFWSKAVIITSGTFQNGLIHIGRINFTGGRISEPSSIGVSDQLKKMGFQVERMKTGTPARIDGRSINFSVLEEQKSENEGGFSFLYKNHLKNKRFSCYITYTNSEVHRILEKGFKDSPLYLGIIKGIGPRYCPSIEDKIVTFQDKESHQLFVEPEGENTVEYYLNGFSSSLPWDIQYKAIRKIKGLENAKIFRPGYAIEYDYYPPTQLKVSLETKMIENLYFAGQINGTTGYEEAAAQGLVAGINANRKVFCKEEFIIKRDEGYIGVLIDDLITKGVDEPYRMFTSRAEYRILLRQDNADERLTKFGYEIGLASLERFNKFQNKKKNKNFILKYLSTTSINPVEINEYLQKNNTSEISQKIRISEIISRPQIDLVDFAKYFNLEKRIRDINFDQETLEAIDIYIKYSGYIDREKQMAEKAKRLENIIIPDKFDFLKIKSLSTESRIKLNRIRPKNIGQASRISGVAPSDINILLVYIGR
jgi:tRNA uridine 5-carboxymethylaminomethyl modification enzyme